MPNIINDTRKKVKGFLKQMYGSKYSRIVQEIDDQFIIRRGSAVVHVAVKPFYEDECLVESLAYVVHGARITPTLTNMLLRANATYPIGAYGITNDGTIIYKHNSAGVNLDMNELRIAINTVAWVADEEDDKIVKLAGGLRAVDANAGILGDLTEMAAEQQPKAKKAAQKTPAKAASRKAR